MTQIEMEAMRALINGMKELKEISESLKRIADALEKEENK